jgi:hypothetical protein
MIDERKIEIIAKNFSYDYLNKHKKALEKMIRITYIEGFKEGVRKAAETCSRCEGKDESFEHGADVCKSCKRGVIVDD